MIEMSRNIPIKVERREDTSNYYAESIQLVHSMAGFKLIIFRDRAEYAEEARIGPEALIPRSITKEIIAEVSFSPQQLKIMNKVIEEQIKNYESRFGTITIPDKTPKKDNSTATFV